MEVLYRETCPVCRSRGGDYDGDNVARYEDGHGFCFACETWFPPKDDDGVTTVASGDRRKTVAKELIPVGEYMPLPKRKLTEKTLSKFGYTVGKYNGKTVHIAPYYKDGELVAQHIRFPDKDFIWRGNSKGVELFGQHLWKTGGRRITVTEGEIDAMTISQVWEHKWAVVSIPSGVKSAKKAFIDNLEFLEAFDEVNICFDNDEVGQAAAIEAAAVLSIGKAKICTLPLKDASDMLQAGRSGELVQCLWNGSTYRPDGIVSAKDLLEDLLTDPPVGFTSPYPKLNEMLQGLRKRELILFTAGSGIGKSTFVHEIAKYLADEHDQRIGIMALEESKKRTLERYVGMELNKPIHTPKGRAEVTKEDLITAFNKVTDGDKLWFYDHFGSTQIEQLLSKIRYMIKGLNIDWLVLDHISIVVSGLQSDEGERKTIDILMTALRSLIEETGIGVLAIVHLKRPDKGKSFNEGRQVSLTDLRGSGSLEQLSDVVIAVERDQQDAERANIATIRVLKSRLIGVLGECDQLEYDHDTGRLKATDGFNFGFNNPEPIKTGGAEGEEEF